MLSTMLEGIVMLSKSDSKNALSAIALTSESSGNWTEFMHLKLSDLESISATAYSRDSQVTDRGIKTVFSSSSFSRKFYNMAV